MVNKKFIAIIPARGGSKQIKNKNIKKFLGKPLINWTIEAAIKSKVIDKIYVSTDSKKIVQVCKKLEELGGSLFAGHHNNINENVFDRLLNIEEMSKKGMENIHNNGLKNVVKVLENSKK